MTSTICNDHKIHYEYLSNPGKPVVAFVNSLGTNFTIWNDVVDLIKDEYAILRFDKRGHGQSEEPKTTPSIQDYADDLLALLDELKIDKIHLVGLSIGGMISMLFTNQHEDRVEKLVLSDTAPIIGNEQDWNARIRVLGIRGISFLSKSIIERWFAPSFAEQQPAAVQDYKKMLESTSVSGYAGACAAIRDADLYDDLRSITIPVLCICGGEDLSTPIELVKEMAYEIDAKYVQISRTGHLPCVENPTKFSSTIIKFFEN